VGVISAGAALAGLSRTDERLVFASIPPLTPQEAALGVSSASPHEVAERIIDHVDQGVRAAQELGLPADAVRAIETHHERWDGSGYSRGLSRVEIPLLGRVLAVADEVEALVAQEPSPLLARRNLPFWLSGYAGNQLDADLIQAMRTLSSGDEFWMGLYSPLLATDLMIACSRLRESRGQRLVQIATGFSELVDSRFPFTAGVSQKVARLAESLGRQMGFPDQRLRQLHVAALLHDVGQLSVSERIMAKPGILTVEELEIMRHHPSYSRDVVAAITGLEEVAEWIACHHERPDGRGYPDGRMGDEIPVEARILAVADAYVAITSDRPHRARVENTDGMRRMRSAAGTQLDAHLVDLFLARVVA
jgi:HD-GYP domain-containing protein (c-di-GMP phosphodiesterase class II)